MKKLLEKLEALVDEATLLVREERQRRAAAALVSPPDSTKAAPITVNPPVMVPFAPYVPSRTAPVPPDWAQPWQPPLEITCGTTLTKDPPIAMTAWNAGCAGAINLGQVWCGETVNAPQLLWHLRHH